MANNEYIKNVEKYLHGINECIEITKELAIEVIGENLIDLDLCFCALMDRSIRLAQGFVLMVENRNLTCAGALLRLQLDNCLRLYAINIAEDEKAIVDCLLKGEKIRNLKDKSGKKMSDGYLKGLLVQYDEKFETVYDNTSGYVHFSEKAIYQSIYECEDMGIKFQVGGELNEKRNKYLIECAAAFLHYYSLFLHLMEGEAAWKKNFDKTIKEKGMQ
ncbi:MAG: hypothetical protein K5669_09515 [Lachnospiraceae bacterium]|nr:hypothetical protein [Lachnospiraceae bacterium]